MTRGLRQILSAFRESMKCPSCGKSQLVSNTAGYRQKFRAEPVSAETHCFCPGSPMHDYVKQYQRTER